MTRNEKAIREAIGAEPQDCVRYFYGCRKDVPYYPRGWWHQARSQRYHRILGEYYLGSSAEKIVRDYPYGANRG